MHLRAIMFKDDKKFVIQVLERDICVQGKTAGEAKTRLLGTIRTEKKEGTYDGLKEAPKKFNTMFLNGTLDCVLQGTDGILIQLKKAET